MKELSIEELSIEEKAKRYDEIIGVAKSKYETIVQMDEDCTFAKEGIVNTFHSMFTELKESEDEVMRAMAIKAVHAPEAQSCIKSWGINPNDVIAWLEKQTFYFKIELGNWYKCLCDYTLPNGDIEFKYNKLYYCSVDWRLDGEIDARNVKNIGVKGYKSFFRPATNQEIQDWLEKQGEQNPETIFLKFRIGDKVTNGEDTYTINFIGKDCYWVKEHDCATIPFEYQHLWKLVEQIHTDKIEPKFKVGDWIVNKGHSYLIGYIDYEQGRYLFEIGGYTHEQLNWEYIENADNKYHLWTIEDAKDGDALACNINKAEIGGDIEKLPNITPTICLYQNVVKDKDYIHTYCSLYNGSSLLLSNSMYYNTFVYNIHPATKEQREQLEKEITEAGYEWNADKKELKKIEQNPAWNEEDEKMLESFLHKLEVCDPLTNKENNWFLNKFKSLKYRYTWKPSEKQKEALLWCVVHLGGADKQTLGELLEELNKL